MISAEGDFFFRKAFKEKEKIAYPDQGELCWP